MRGLLYVKSLLDAVLTLAAKPMALKMGALIIHSASFLQRAKLVCAYTAPIVKTAHTAAFFIQLSFRLQTALIGTSKINASLIVLNSPLIWSNTGRLMQLPGISLFQARAFGSHWKTLTMVMAV
jgi:hypothetical protein